MVGKRAEPATLVAMGDELPQRFSIFQIVNNRLRKIVLPAPLAPHVTNVEEVES